MSGGPRPKVDVRVLLMDGRGRLLFARRRGPGFADGLLGLPGGGLEHGESAAQGAARELLEEVGVRVRPDDLALAHVSHQDTGRGMSRVGFFFTVPAWEGPVDNLEPDQCEALYWQDPAHLPDDVIPFIAEVVALIRAGERFSAHGW